MRALITAASRHGGTKGIAAAVAQGLRERAVLVDVVDPDDVHDVSRYDLVVIGSAVYVGRWLPAAKALVARHASALRWRDVWLFSSGPLGDPPQPEQEPADVVPMLSASGARGHALFSGRLNRSELGLGERLVVAAVHAPLGDYRDWGAIREWASGLVDVAQQDGTSVGQDGPLVPVPDDLR
jgi:menaquinone-dependent protoporphyrinogen oxidase